MPNLAVADDENAVVDASVCEKDTTEVKVKELGKFDNTAEKTTEGGSCKHSDEAMPPC